MGNRLVEHTATVRLAGKLHLLDDAKPLRSIELDQMRSRRWSVQCQLRIVALARPTSGELQQGLAAARALEARVDRELVQAGDIRLSVPWAFAVALGRMQRHGADKAAIADRHIALAEPHSLRGRLDALIDAGTVKPHATEMGEGSVEHGRQFVERVAWCEMSNVKDLHELLRQTAPAISACCAVESLHQKTYKDIEKN